MRDMLCEGTNEVLFARYMTYPSLQVLYLIERKAQANYIDFKEFEKQQEKWKQQQAKLKNQQHSQQSS